MADTGALRATGAAFDFIVGAVAARELSGYVLSQSPRQAIVKAGLPLDRAAQLSGLMAGADK